MFLAAALVVLPLSPNRALGPFGAFNLRKICELVVLVMAVSAAGYIALRALGARLGLTIAGFFGGFISAGAAIASLGRHLRHNPKLESAATSGAVLTTVATVVQMFLVLVVTNVATCRAMAVPLLFAGAAALGYASLFIAFSSRGSAEEPAYGRAFDLRTALFFAVTISAVLFFCGFLNQRYGSRGLFLGAAISGLADTHATAISIASMVSSAKLGPQAAVLPILLSFASNSLTKSVVAFTMGGFRFGLRILLGLILVLSAAFLGMWVSSK